jgi:peptidoglycan/xylan/chitin deacetylase (PgdA/CDA1 family)
VTHRAFVGLANAEIEHEITESTKALSDLTGKRPAALAFAYPYGFVTAHAAAMVARTCRAGFTCHARPISMIDRDATLPRFNLDRHLSDKLRAERAASAAFASARECVLLYARTDLGRRATAPLRRTLKALGMR